MFGIARRPRINGRSLYTAGDGTNASFVGNTFVCDVATQYMVGAEQRFDGQTEIISNSPRQHHRQLVPVAGLPFTALLLY